MEERGRAELRIGARKNLVLNLTLKKKERKKHVPDPTHKKLNHVLDPMKEICAMSDFKDFCYFLYIF